jgi:hypothetical protein
LSGVRCAETTSTSWATPNSERISDALRIVGQSLSEPMTIATRGGTPGPFARDGAEEARFGSDTS